MKNKIVVLGLLTTLAFTACAENTENEGSPVGDSSFVYFEENVSGNENDTNSLPEKNSDIQEKGHENDSQSDNNETSEIKTYQAIQPYEMKISLDSSLKYASNSKINSGEAILYHNSGTERCDIVICVNAGHGTSGGNGVKTLSHPDGSPKVTGGTTASGAVESTAISSGMVFLDGVAESKVTLEQALILKDVLYNAGYSVLMIRETDDVQLDNVARTVIANNYANCHISLHWDSTENAKGAFYISVPNNASYRAMEPVASTWEESEKLGQSLINGLKSEVKIMGNGSMEIDLTQTAYSTIPSVDLELGDKATDHSKSTLEANARGILKGLDEYFGFYK